MRGAGKVIILMAIQDNEIYFCLLLGITVV